MQVCFRAVLVAMSLNTGGSPVLLDIKVDDSESEPSSWREVLATLTQRGLSWARLVVSAANVGLTQAVG
jgi:transposase-like protein